jgi:hypothetical protein
MKMLLILVRVAASVVGGWYLLLAWAGLFYLFGMHTWGFFHSGLILPLYPLDVFVLYWLLGYLPPFKTRPNGAPRDTPQT